MRSNVFTLAGGERVPFFELTVIPAQQSFVHEQTRYWFRQTHIYLAWGVYFFLAAHVIGGVRYLVFPPDHAQRAAETDHGAPTRRRQDRERRHGERRADRQD